MAEQTMIRTVLKAMLLLLMLSSQQALALVRVYPGSLTVDFGVWDGLSPSLSVTSQLCVQSVQGNFWSGTVTDYQARLQDGDGVSAFFEFLPTGMSAGTGAQVSATYTDPLGGNSYNLVPATYTPRNLTGLDIWGCLFGGINGQLQLSISASELEKLPTGTHTRTLELQVRGGNGNQRRRINVDMQVNVPTLIQMRNLDDVTLSAWAAGSDMTGSDTFCVYSNAASGQYTVTLGAEDSTGAAIGAYEMDNGNGDVLPYEVLLNGVAVTPGQVVNNLPTGCPADNQQVDFRVLANDTLTVPAGNYAGHVVMTVSPI